MGKNLDKFLLLLWKNWKLQYRRPIQTTVEIVTPILFSALLVILRGLIDPVENPIHIFSPFQPISSDLYLNYFNTRWNNTTASKNSQSSDDFFQNFSLVYSPSPNTALDHCMNILKTVFKNIKGYRNSTLLENHFLTEEGQNTLAGIQFDDTLYNKSVLPRNLEVTLRFPGELRSITGEFFEAPSKNVTTANKKMNNSGNVVDKLNKLFGIKDWKTNLLYPVFQTSGPREPDKNKGATPYYYAEGFLALQVIITYLLVLGQKGIVSLWKLPLINVQRFPHAPWNDDPLLPALISFIGMLMMLSFVYTCINTVKVITNEKEKQLKEAMKIMGLPNWLHWSAWFIKSLTFLLTSILFIVALLKIRWYPNTSNSVFTHANPIILFLFLLVYICATITFCFSISVFFSKANTAATVAGLLWFLSYTPYMFLQLQYDQLTLGTKLVACLGSNTAMAYGFQMFLMYEGTNEGIQWHNIWKPNSTDDSLTLGFVLLMLATDAIIYLSVALYVEAIFPGEYGTAQPWYFPFSCNYWFGSPKLAKVENYGDSDATRSDRFEGNSPDLQPGIQIKNLRKLFGKKVAVNNLSLDMYYDQITVLLGQNGAGKTSTMSVLTGIIPATSGTAFLEGFDIRTNMKDVRANLGLCPQHHILFDDLTVREHLYFFSKLKGLPKDQIDGEIDKYIKLLELEVKSDKKSSTLSGGMKRKLCVGIALCGGSKIILLDEPTAGIDPTSRRAVWDLLQMEKKGRCLLLTTHYMDEADLLGDRIAIMANGSLKCCGSSFFLKKKYGAGYHLILDKLPNCDPSSITKLLQTYIPDIKISSNVGSELSYLLKEDYVTIFEKMLADLEANTQRLGIRSYGISLPTLEDVFGRVGADSTLTQREIQEARARVYSHPQPKSPSKNIAFLNGFELIRNQCLAMLMKKSLSIFRAWLLQVIQILIPVTFLIIAILVSRKLSKNKLKDLPKLPLTLEKYGNPIVLVQDDIGTNLSRFYLETVTNYTTKNVTNLTESMLNLSRTDPSTARRQYLVGGSFQLNEYEVPVLTAWFNNNPYHTPPLALGLVLNAFYKSSLGRDYNISFANHPLPFTTDTKVEKLLKGHGIGFQLAFNIGFSMAFVSSFYVLFYIKERVCKSKHLQFASGVKSYIFWATSFICDLITFIVTILFVLLTLVCFQEEGFRSFKELGRMFFLLFYFGFSMLPMMYFASYFFEVPSTGYTRMTLFSVVTGVTAFLVVQILATPGLSLKYIADALHWGFLFIPHYSLATGIRDTYLTFAIDRTCDFFVNNCVEQTTGLTVDDCWDMACNNNHSQVLRDFCCVREHDYFQWESPGVGRNLFYSFLLGLILFLLLNLVEYKIFLQTIQYCSPERKIKILQAIPDEDDDVLEEKEKIRNAPESELLKDHSLVLKDMTKYYEDILAVNGLCLGIKQFECFGLLGVNGAGKTTTFKMITGDIKTTYGDAWVQGFSVTTHLKRVQRVIGYCPQFDALLLDLTAKETLIIYALIRGIPSNQCGHITENLAKEFDFYQYFNKKVKHLSGGNKRKLSTAISLIGDPPVICLDEPTAGMDPITKRNLWNAICTVRDNGKCVLLTSHSMEECEALCTRIAIMVNGNFKCLGSVQHLKNKFASGYTLTIKIKRSGDLELQFDDVDKFVLENFPTAVKQEKHQELVSYHVVDGNLSWSKMFGILEREKNRLKIEDYSLGQATLEQIFLSLTKFQR